MDLQNILNEVVGLVREAGSMAKSKTVTGIQTKGDFDFVTQTDQMVDAFLREKLAGLIPGSRFVTEENDERDYSFEKPTWIVDPIDGTSNLIFGFNHSAVSVGLLVDGVPTCGVVHNPFTDETFTAIKGSGAFLNGKKIQVSSHKTMSGIMVGVGTNPYKKEDAALTFGIIERVFKECVDIRRTGAGAIDLCYVACGRLGGFFEKNLKPWDIAAGLVILREAGGTATRWDLTPLNLATPEDVLASNNHIHKELQSYLA